MANKKVRFNEIPREERNVFVYPREEVFPLPAGRGARALRSILRNRAPERVPAYMRNEVGREEKADEPQYVQLADVINDPVAFRRFIDASNIRINGEPSGYDDLAQLEEGDVVTIDGVEYPYAQIIRDKWPIGKFSAADYEEVPGGIGAIREMISRGNPPPREERGAERMPEYVPVSERGIPDDLITHAGDRDEEPVAPFEIPYALENGARQREARSDISSNFENMRPYGEEQFQRFINNSDLRINGLPAIYEDLPYLYPNDVVTLNGQDFTPEQIRENLWPHRGSHWAPMAEPIPGTYEYEDRQNLFKPIVVPIKKKKEPEKAANKPLNRRENILPPQLVNPAGPSTMPAHGAPSSLYEAVANAAQNESNDAHRRFRLMEAHWSDRKPMLDEKPVTFRQFINNARPDSNFTLNGKPADVRQALEEATRNVPEDVRARFLPDMFNAPARPAARPRNAPERLLPPQLINPATPAAGPLNAPSEDIAFPAGRGPGELIPQLRTAAPGAPRGPNDNGRHPGRPGRPGRPGGGPEEPDRPFGNPAEPEGNPDIAPGIRYFSYDPEQNISRALNLPQQVGRPGNVIPGLAAIRGLPGVPARPAPAAAAPPAGPRVPQPVPQPENQAVPQLPAAPAAPQLPAQQYARPAGMAPNARLRDIRNNNRGMGLAAPGAAVGTAATAATILAPFLSNPVTAAVAATVGTALGAGPAMWSKAEQWSLNNKMDYSEGRILDLMRSPNANSPEVQRELAQERQNLANYAVRMHELAPQNPQVMEYINHLSAGVQPTVAPQAGQPGQPGTPQESILGGRPEFIERVGLLTPEQQALQNRDIQQLMQNPASFEPIAQNEVRRLKEEVLPYVAEQYFGRNPNSFGGAYPEALGRAASSLGERLASARADYESRREERLYRNAMNPAFSPLHHQRIEGLGESIGKRVLGGAVDLGGQLLERGVREIGTRGANWLGNAFRGNQQQPAGQLIQAQPANYMPEPLSTINYNRRPSAQNIAQGAPDVQRSLMEAAENRNYALGGRRR